MLYDEHYAGSPEAGSVASIDFVEDGIAKTVEQVPPEKVINAIPFYTRIWETSNGQISSQAVGMEAAQEYVNAHSISVEWDEAARIMGNIQRAAACSRSGWRMWNLSV